MLPQVTEVGVELASPIEGTVLNYRYQVEQVFNDKGGMGLIYRATDLNLRSTVILKKSRFVDEQSRAAFEREARLLYGLRHNALPRVIDYFITEDASQFFVMEFIPGQDLSEMLGDRVEKGIGPFPIETVLDWGDQLLDALHYLHNHQPPIIHRDIKPQNLKLMPNGQVILLDFGLAKGAVSGMTLANASIQGYTPNYAPLEQMRGSGTDARSDIYSLAVTMHCLLTGQMPPDAVSRAIETLSAQPDPLRAIHDINPNFPRPISEALQRACSLNQNERPATALAMRDVLRDARKRAAQLASPSNQPSAHPSAAPGKPTTLRGLAQQGEAKTPSQAEQPLAAPASSPVVPAASSTPAQQVAVQAEAKNKPSAAPMPEPAKVPTAPDKIGPDKGANSPAAKREEAAATPKGPEKVDVAAASPVAAPDPVAGPAPAPAVAQAKQPLAPKAEAALQPGLNTDSLAPSPFDTMVDPLPSRSINDWESPSQYDTVVDLPPSSSETSSPAEPKPEALKPEAAPRPEVRQPDPTPATPVNPAPHKPKEIKPKTPAPHEPAPKQHFRPAAAPAQANQPVPVRREPVQALAPAAPPAPAAPAGDDPLRPTSLVLIEHKDDGKPVRPAEPPPAAPTDYAARSRVVQAPGSPTVNKPPQRPSANEQLARRNSPLPATPSYRLVGQQFQEPSLSLLREPPVEVETPSQGDVLPNIDLTGVLANPNIGAVTPKGMRSFTEIIALNVRMEMHAIPGGEFLMGSPKKRGYADEYPQHRVTLSAFYIGKYPITQAQWRAVMRTNPSHFNGNNHPVDSITWDEAVEFCRRLSYATNRNYRLPTEAEWEFACRAGTTTLYNYGDEEDLVMQYAWCLPNSGNHTHPVGEKKPNGWGLYDMHGNVWEWCQDWYGGDYYQYSPNVNPAGPTKGTSRVLRGGSWYSLPNYCRSAGRSNHQPELRDPLVGFRVVCDGKPT